MRFVNGPLAVYAMTPQAKSSGECAVAVSANPVRNCIAMLSQVRLHFWTSTGNIVYLGSLPIEGTCTDEDPATHLLWHPRGDHLVVATLQRRVVFFEVSVNISNRELLSPTYHERSLHVGSVASHVRRINEERLEAGIVTSLSAGGSNCLFACTTAGVVCVIGWFQQRLLHTWSCHFLCQETHIFSCPGDVGGESADSGGCMARGEFLAGAIVDACHTPQLKLTTLLLSNGHVILAQSNVGGDFTRDDIAFSGACGAATYATRVAVNSRHMLLAMATHAGDVVCRRINEDLSLASFWNGLKCLKGKGQPRPISGIQWSPDEEMLCVGFYHHDVIVVHYTSACVYSSLSIYHPQRSMIEGCVSFSWSSQGHRLLLIQPHVSTLTVLAFSEIVSSPTCDVRGCFTPVIAFDNDTLRLAGHSGPGGDFTFNDIVSLHSEYAIENYPLTYAAVSPLGTVVALAGKNGFVLFDRFTRRWRALRDKNQEREMVCVAQPLWLSSVAVVMPLHMVRTRTYAIRVYAHRYLDATALLTHVPLNRKPLQMCECHGDDANIFLLVMDSSNTVLVWRCVISSRGLSPTTPSISVSLELIKSVKLSSGFLNPVGMVAIHPARFQSQGAPRRLSSVSQNGSDAPLPYVLFILRGSHALVAIDLTTAVETSDVPPSYATIRSGCVYRIWVDNSPPINGSIILVFGDNGISVIHLFITCDGMISSPVVCEYGVGVFDEDSLPVGLSTYDGCLLTASGVSDVLRFGSGIPPITCVRMAIRPLLYNYRVLAALTRSGTPNGVGLNGKMASLSPAAIFVPLVWNDGLFYWLERMRTNGTFISNADHYLHTLIDETPPAGIDQLDRRVAVQATVSLLRRYSEFYTVVVNCVRKMDVSRWRIVLDVLGSPVELFRECLEICRFEEAAHLLRVIMVDRGVCRGNASVEALGGVMTCAIQLLICALGKRNVQLIHDLLRFMALLHDELSVHTVQNDDDGTPGVWARLCSVIGLQQDISGASSLEGGGPLMFLDSEDTLSGLCTSKMAKRRYVVEFLLRKCPDVNRTLVKVATESLLLGHFLKLREILQEFFISLLHFIREKSKVYSLSGARGTSLLDEGAKSDEMMMMMYAHHNLLSGLFDGIHAELGLPRSERCIGAGFQRYYLSCDVGEDATCGGPCAWWTTAQSFLYSTPWVLEVLLSLRDQYAVWDVCAVVIDIILMNESSVVEQLKSNSALVEALQHLVTLPKNKGYGAFVQVCVKRLE